MRTLLAFGIILALAACGGGSTGTAVPQTGYGSACDPGTQVTLARPSNGQTGVSTGTTTIEIVANGNNNTLYQSYQSWDLYLVPQYGFGGQLTTGMLSLTSDNTGPHPYPQDFYYNATLTNGALQPGQTYAVYLNANVNCSPVGPLGYFST